MEMTYNGYIMNPMGKENAVFSQRDMYRKLYTSKMDNVILREGSNFKYTLYHDDSTDSYYCHIKVPSEVIDKFYYDVVIMFYTKDKVEKTSNTLRNYFVKFYSNDPAFVYTFAHAFIKNKLFIEDLEAKMSKEAVRKAAVEKNPSNIVGYVKSIYFAYLIMSNNSLFDKSKYKTAKKYNKKELAKDIMDASEKIALRQEAQQKLDSAKKRERINDKKKQTSTASNTTKAVNVIKPIKKISSSFAGNVHTIGKIKPSTKKK